MAMEVSERLRKIIASSPLEINGTKIRIAASIGVAEYSEAMRNFDGLLSNADFAMYDAMNGGRNRVGRCMGKEISLLGRSEDRQENVLALADEWSGFDIRDPPGSKRATRISFAKSLAERDANVRIKPLAAFISLPLR